MDDYIAHAVGGDVDVVWNYRYDQIGAGCDRPTRYLVGSAERVETSATNMGLGWIDARH